MQVLAIFLFSFLFSVLSVCTPFIRSGDVRLSQIKLPPGFMIEVYADNVPNARSMAWNNKNTLYVGSRTAGNVYAVIDRDADFIADTVITIASGLNMPNGVVYHEGSLYVAEVNRVLRYDHIDSLIFNPPAPVVVNDSFPSDKHHGWKYMALGPDKKLYVPVGAPCNICERKDDVRYSSMMRMNLDGNELEIFATGIRNTVGFDWDAAGRLWFTDNGRDWMGDDSPPDELNVAAKSGLHFGYPYCHGGTISDPEFGQKAPCANFESPAINLGAHVASLGMKVYTKSMFPEQYVGGVFIAEHGSWNRSSPVGYKVSFVKIEDGRAVAYTPFAQGWLAGARALGRPVDILVLYDGSLLVSDDHANVIYRISYVE